MSIEKFQVGDLVRVKEPKEPFSAWSNEFVGYVVDVGNDTDGSTIFTVEDGNGDDFDVSLNDLEMVD